MAACFSLLFAIPRGARVSKHSFKTFASSTPSLPARRFRRQISRNRGETFTRRRTLCAAKDDPNSRFAASLFGFIFPPPPCGRRAARFSNKRALSSVEISPWRSTTWGRPGYVPSPASKAIFLISKRIAIRVHSSWTQFGGNGDPPSSEVKKTLAFFPWRKKKEKRETRRGRNFPQPARTRVESLRGGGGGGRRRKERKGA